MHCRKIVITVRALDDRPRKPHQSKAQWNGSALVCFASATTAPSRKGGVLHPFLVCLQLKASECGTEVWGCDLHRIQSQQF